MPQIDRQPDLDEIARLGDEVYDRQVRPRLQPDDHGKFVALDIKSGDFEVHEDDYTAIKRLRARDPEAEIWLCRVGEPAAYRMRRGR